MKAIRLLVGLVFLVFTAESVYVLYSHGVMGFLALATANDVTRLLVADVLLALSIVAVWMVTDARERNTSAAPYLAITALLGSSGPLLYLWRRLGPNRAEAATADGRLARRAA